MPGGLKFSGGANHIETVEIIFFREIPYFQISPNGIQENHVKQLLYCVINVIFYISCLLKLVCLVVFGHWYPLPTPTWGPSPSFKEKYVWKKLYFFGGASWPSHNSGGAFVSWGRWKILKTLGGLPYAGGAWKSWGGHQNPLPTMECGKQEPLGIDGSVYHYNTIQYNKLRNLGCVKAWL